MKHIVIVGGSFGGVSTAHRFLKQASKVTEGSFKVTLVSRDSHFYWNIATPRALIPGQIPDEKIFQPIAPGFAHYPKGSVEVILGTATGIDAEGKKLEVTVDGQTQHIVYDYLILATGSKYLANTPFKSQGSTEDTIAGLHEMQEQIRHAKNIVVVGSGATGVEISGELGFEYGAGEKKITLISRGATVLEGRPDKVTQTAEKQLQSLNVNLQLNTSIKDTVQLPDGSKELVLSDGKKLAADLIIPTNGVVPNSSFVPSKFLNKDGFIRVDDDLRVIDSSDIFAIGDVSDHEPPQYMFVEKQSIHMAKNIVHLINNMPLVPHKASTTAMMGLQIGKKTGTGHMGNFKIPSFLVHFLRKTLFVENLPKTVDGSML
ncbi:hypothetical protein F5Y16DRAFT_412739 [Xylariaceae sp. FL0255]|nr:hypothetical protein F5Y16DRAFT_412739 [Xylariaceae sp. FL0255]